MKTNTIFTYFPFVFCLMLFSIFMIGMPQAYADETDTGTTIAPKDISWTPSGVDLRERGVVTPVKDQSPWGTCWSFGAIAAAETSILSKENTTYADTKLDLSERHLIYFANSAITKATSESQAGEGIYFQDGVKSKNDYYNGGLNIISSTLFSSGAGPVLEKDYPYHGKESLTEYLYALRNKEAYKKIIVDGYKAGGNTPTKEEVERGYKEELRTLKAADYYSSHDDWSLSDTDRDKTAGYVLIDSNTFDKMGYYDEETRTQVLDPTIMNALKDELRKGRGISASFCADASSPGDDLNMGQYMNFNTYAHYTYDLIGDSHTICIVGYDDNYPKENFLQGTTADGVSKAPPANGAWICKNSWGSETDFVINKDGRPIGKRDFGLLDKNGKHTGYFYLSYYDKSITAAETFNFSKKMKSNIFSVYQHDYLAPLGDFYYETSKNDLSCMDVYVADKDETLLSVGIRTAQPNSTVALSVYRLESDSDNLVSEEILGAASAQFDYAGYHRFTFDEPIHVGKSDKFAVALTTKLEDGENYLQANMCPSKQDTIKNDYYQYGIAKVNPGESFVFKNGEWIDWVDYKQGEDFKKALKTNLVSTPEQNEVDNFTIKVYGVPDGSSEEIVDPSKEDSERKAAGTTEKTNQVSNSKKEETQTPAKEKTEIVGKSSSATPKTGDSLIPAIACFALSLFMFLTVVLVKHQRKSRCRTQ